MATTGLICPYNPEANALPISQGLAYVLKTVASFSEALIAVD